MDKVKDEFGKAKAGLSDFVETTRLRHDVSKLTHRRSMLFTELGRQVWAMRTQGHVIPEVDPQCKEIEDLDKEITRLGQEIALINNESSAQAHKAAIQ
jgi:hypothetical protein